MGEHSHHEFRDACQLCSFHSILSIEDVLQKVHFDRLQTHAIMLDDGYYLTMVVISPLDLLHSPLPPTSGVFSLIRLMF